MSVKEEEDEGVDVGTNAILHQWEIDEKRFLTCLIIIIIKEYWAYCEGLFSDEVDQDADVML